MQGSGCFAEPAATKLHHHRTEPGLVFHYDRGKQYIDKDVRRNLKTHGTIQSMNSTGNCYDNAMAESLFASFKKGHLFWEPLQTKEEARRHIRKYFEVFYNFVRCYSSLGYKSPVAYELQQAALA